MSHYKTCIEIKWRKWRIDEERKAMGLAPMYAPYEKEEMPKKPKRNKTNE